MDLKLTEYLRPYKTIVLLTSFLTETLAIAYVNNGLQSTQTTNTFVKQSQLLRFSPIKLPTIIDKDLIFDINYSHSLALNIKLLSISLKLHWGYNQLSYQAVANLFNHNILNQSIIRTVSKNFGNAPYKEVYIQFTWFDEPAYWPKASLSPTLSVANFKTALDLTASTVHFSASNHLHEMAMTKGIYIDLAIQSPAQILKYPSA